MAYRVLFKATDEQIRKMIALAVKAAFNEEVSLSQIPYYGPPVNITKWKGKDFSMLMYCTDGVWSLQRGPRLPWSRSPYFKQYPTALSLVEAAGCEVVQCLTYEEHLHEMYRLYPNTRPGRFRESNHVEGAS